MVQWVFVQTIEMNFYFILKSTFRQQEIFLVFLSANFLETDELFSRDFWGGNFED